MEPPQAMPPPLDAPLLDEDPELPLLDSDPPELPLLDSEPPPLLDSEPPPDDPEVPPLLLDSVPPLDDAVVDPSRVPTPELSSPGSSSCVRDPHPSAARAAKVESVLICFIVIPP